MDYINTEKEWIVANDVIWDTSFHDDYVNYNTQAW